MSHQNIIVIGGSAGGLEPLTTIVECLPRELNAALFVVLHTPPESSGNLPQILQRSGPLTATFPADGEAIRHSQIYVTPPDHHLLIQDGAIGVMRGPRENGFRPAIDPLFRSAARVYDGRVIGVILSGALDDGTFGLMAIKKAGGTAIVQHPYEAGVPSMPLTAIQSVEVDHIVRAGQMAGLIVEAAGATAGAEIVPALPARKSKMGDRDITLAGERPENVNGTPTYVTCPECGGSLWEVSEGNSFRFRCHTGHGFTPDTLLGEQNGHLEQALWSAIRVFQERAALHRRLAEQATRRGLESLSDRFEDRAQEEEQRAATIRQLVARGVHLRPSARRRNSVAHAAGQRRAVGLACRTGPRARPWLHCADHQPPNALTYPASLLDV